MRPRNLDEFFGQDRVVGPGRLLRRAIQLDRLSSVILYGPPGTGKTTLASIIADSTSRRFENVNAVLSGVADIRAAIDRAREARDLHGRLSILFVDEVHRWNKAQQDALLPWVENGTVCLIGATTENPWFSVNQALVSRSRVFRLEPLSASDIRAVLDTAISDSERGYGAHSLVFEDGALDLLVRKSQGDARNALNALELAVEASGPSWPPEDGETRTIRVADCEECLQSKALLHDKDGDSHYDCASALIKSLRGGDPDASLYWMARLVASGEDHRFLFRRLMISACEDVGLAAPDVIRTVVACAEAFDRVGLPEGAWFLSHATLAVATAPKSSSASGLFEAMEAAVQGTGEVPSRLRDSSRDADGTGDGADYLYPHSFPGHWVAQDYLPKEMEGRVFYRPGSLGFEATIRDEVLARREATREARTKPSGETARNEPFTDGSSPASRLLREGILRLATIRRGDRVAIYPAHDGLLVWPAARQSSGGFTLALAVDEGSAQAVRKGAIDFDAAERPLALLDDPSIDAPTLARLSSCPEFDVVLASSPGSADDPRERIRRTFSLFPGARIVFGEAVREACLHVALPEGEFRERVAEAESDFNRSLGDAAADEETWRGLFPADEGLAFESERDIVPRIVSGSDVDRWLAPSSRYGKAMRDRLGDGAVRALEEALRDRGGRPLNWPVLLRYAVAIQSPAAGSPTS